MDDLQALAHMGEGAHDPAAQTPLAPVRTPDRVPQHPVSDAGDPQQIHAAIGAASPDHQAKILQRLRLIDQIAQAIRVQTPDPIERARMAQHIAQMHPEMGIDPGMLTPQSMSDANIAALHELSGEATLRVALANLGARAVVGDGRSTATSTGISGQVGRSAGPSAAPRFVPRPIGPSHAAQGFTILGVE